MGIRTQLIALSLLAAAGLAGLVLRPFNTCGPAQGSLSSPVHTTDEPAKVSIDDKIAALIDELDQAAKAGRNADVSRIRHMLRLNGEAILPPIEKTLFGRTYGGTKLALLNLLGEVGTEGCIVLLERFSFCACDPGEDWLVLNALSLLKNCAPARFAELMKSAAVNGNESLQVMARKLEKAEGLSEVATSPSLDNLKYLAHEQCKSASSLKAVLHGEGEDRVKVEAVEVLAEKFPDAREEVLASYVEKNAGSCQWPVNKAIARLIECDSKNKDSRIKELARTGDESLVERILKVAMKLESDNSMEILRIIRNRFDARHVLRMRAEAEIQSRKREQSVGARHALPLHERSVPAGSGKETK